MWHETALLTVLCAAIAVFLAINRYWEFWFFVIAANNLAWIACRSWQEMREYDRRLAERKREMERRRE